MRESRGVPGTGSTSLGRRHRGRSVEDVDHKTEVREFLVTRRARITPEQAGLPAYGGNRRVPGLRREEVAMLAGVSVDYYMRLERGNLGGASESVLDALASALQLDEAERDHLFDLARTANATGARARGSPRSPSVRPTCSGSSTRWTACPPFVRNGRLDVLGANALGRALYSELYEDPRGPRTTRGSSSSTRARREFWVDWDKARQRHRRHPAHPRRAATRTTRASPTSSASSRPAARSSARGGPRTTCASTAAASRRFHHPVVGRLELAFEASRAARRPRPDDARLHRRAGLRVGGRPQAARQLGGDPPSGDRAGGRTRVTRHPLVATSAGGGGHRLRRFNPRGIPHAVPAQAPDHEGPRRALHR